MSAAMDFARWALGLQLLATPALAGLIWTVQIVVYPQFARAGASTFVAYHAAHGVLISWLVGPLMVTELVAAITWVAEPGELVSRRFALVGLALVLAAWGVTAFVSVPLHNTLSGGFEPSAHTLLVRTNWLRTVIWSLRAGLLVWLVMSRLPATPRA